MYPPLYAITPDGLNDAELLAKSRALLQGGCTWLQYRDKSQDPVRRERQARALLALCHEHNAQLIINDDVALACLINADGVHLGQGDGSHKAVRTQLGPHKIFGVTCHDDLQLAKRAIGDGASYIAFGRFFPSNTKPDARPAPLSLIGDARRAFPNTQICVIGGINHDRATLLRDAGADTLAVSEALFNAADPALATRRFLDTLSRR